MTATLLTQATTDCLLWSKLTTAAENSTTPWKHLQKFPNNTLIAQQKNIILCLGYTDKKQTKNFKVVDTHWTWHIEMFLVLTMIFGTLL